MFQCGAYARLNEPLKCIFKRWNGAILRQSSSLAQDFEQAQTTIKSLKNEPDDGVRLTLYGLYKQATVGPCNIPKPGTFDVIGKAKWDAWSKLESIGKDNAQKQYVKLANELASAEGLTAATESSSKTADQDGVKLQTSDNGVTTITLNRPEKRNALTMEMYSAITQMLNEEATNERTAFLVFRGAGDYYCSGNDLNNFLKMAAQGDLSAVSKNAIDILRQYVTAFIDFPKPLVAAINGPAMGIAVTTLGLFDVVYAADNATFCTPFSSLGQTPEACSTYTFPLMMGTTMACQLLMLNKKITATEAKSANLVTEIFPSNSFTNDVDLRLQDIAALPKLPLLYAKKLMRDPMRENLHKANLDECERLVERVQSQDCQRAFTAFFRNK